MIKIVTMTNFVFTVIIQDVSQSNLIYLRYSHENLENVFEKIYIMNVIIMLTKEEMLLLILSVELYVLRCHRYQTIWIIIVFKLTAQTLKKLTY